ncbi:MAG TPA: HD domain-containing protein, partial [Ignavibacteria bacterium]|nr:HD domain-containing protein [Ignavibacteria bacterium]
NTDVSHDFEHALRVLFNAERIAKEEGGDFDIIVPATLFHDLIVYPKNHSDKHKSQEKSAEATVEILNSFGNFPKNKIEKVKTCILECSFSKGIMPKLFESKILQDADGLEATGAISIMRTYSSTGQMKRPFYNANDPFCENREPDASHFALDLFYERLLKVEKRMHTKTAKKIARRRTDFLIDFLKEFKLELDGK